MKYPVWAIAPLILALPGGALPAQPPAAPTTPMVQIPVNISGPKLRVSNLDRSIKFYTEGLGLTLSRRIGTTVAVLSSTGKAPPPLIVLVQDAKPIVVGDGMSATMMNVSDSAALRTQLKAAGYATADEGAAGSFLVKDPDGYIIEITGSQTGSPPRRP